jgi:hypothetical protein
MLHIQLEIPDIYQSVYNAVELRAYLQTQLNEYLVEKFGGVLQQHFSEQDLDDLGEEAKAKAWEQYKASFLKNIRTEE